MGGKSALFIVLLVNEGEKMKKIVLLLLVGVMLSSAPMAVFARTHGTDGEVSGRSIGAGALSLIIWPGLGQMVNDQQTDKVVTHALLGLTGIFRFWSCYDAVRDRQGGVWHSRI